MKKTIVYLLVTFGFSWFFWLIKYLAQIDILPDFFSVFGTVAAFGPLIGFLVVSHADGKKIKTNIVALWKSKTSKGIYFFAALSPFFASGLAYLLLVWKNDVEFELGMSLQMIFPIALIILVTGGPLEEFGWRGFLLPKIRAKYPFLISAIIVGLIHGLWHLPLHFISGTVQEQIPIWEFIAITAISAINYSFIYEFSKSIKPMLLFHWFANLSSALFIYWVEPAGRYYLFGITLIIDIILIIIYYRKKSVLSRQDAPS